MDRQTKKGLLIFLLVAGFLLAAGFGSVCYKQAHPFVYEDHLSDVVVSVDGRDVTLRELGCYIYVVEKFVDEQARLYNPSNPSEYWDRRFSAGLKSAFVVDMASSAVYGTCVCDLIYESMAEEAGFSLSDKQEEKARQAAKDIWQEMSDAQKEKTGMTREMLETFERRKILVAAYAKEYIRDLDFTGYAGNPQQLISYDGDYYQKEILPHHTVRYHNSCKNQIEIGQVTLGLDDAGSKTEAVSNR